MMLSMTRNEAVPLDAMKAGMPWDWVTVPEFLDSVERTPKAVNILPYIGLNPLLVWVLGLERAKAGVMPSDEEHKEMKRLLHEAMDAGACGWSVQRLGDEGNIQRDYDGTPMVTDLMHDETAIALAEVLAERNDGFIQLSVAPRLDGGDQRHCELLAEVSGRPVIWNALVALPNLGPLHRGPIAWLKSCTERGLRIYGQSITTDSGMTFTFEDWNLYDPEMPWREATMGTTEERLAKLSDPDRRQALRDSMPGPGAVGGLAETVLLRGATEDSKLYENLTMAEIGELTGKHPVDAMLDIAVSENLKTLFYTEMFGGPRQYQREIVDYEYGIVGQSDGGAHTRFTTLGRYTTEFLIKAVRNNAWLTLEDAHWRLSGFPAYCAGFRGRGIIQEGAPADIVVYDYNKLDLLPIEIAYDYPGGEWRRVQRARGYRYVLVNGAVTIEDDKETGVYSGLLLRHGIAAPPLVAV
jgi:N-acyl-D-aspartate/D-glutamate deacylase